MRNACALLLLGSIPLVAADDPAGIAFFEQKIRPALAEHCYECHSAAKKRPKGGLTLDTRAGWGQGGDSGPALVPGDVEASRLVRAIRTGRLGFDDLKQVALTAMNQIASAAISGVASPISATGTATAL